MPPARLGNGPGAVGLNKFPNNIHPAPANRQSRPAHCKKRLKKHPGGIKIADCALKPGRRGAGGK